MTDQLDARSTERLKGVHIDLVRVILLAHKKARDAGDDFIVVEGLRTIKRQRELFAAGASKTMKSRHITGHAVDLAPLVAGDVTWKWPAFGPLAGHVKDAAQFLGVPVIWGGDWRTFKDGPHFELDRKTYP